MADNTLDNAIAQFIQAKEQLNHDNKQKLSASEKKKLEAFESQILSLMEQAGVDFRQVGNRFVSIEETKKAAKPGKDLEMETMAMFLTAVMEKRKRMTGKNGDQLRAELSDIFGGDILQVPSAYYDFKEKYKMQVGTSVKKLKISETRPYQQVVGSLMEIQ